ncbi:MAG: hypothetical protein ACRD4S_17595 [Candidatus Acidiferrales bacterium]
MRGFEFGESLPGALEADRGYIHRALKWPINVGDGDERYGQQQ